MLERTLCVDCNVVDKEVDGESAFGVVEYAFGKNKVGLCGISVFSAHFDRKEQVVVLHRGNESFVG